MDILNSLAVAEGANTSTASSSSQTSLEKALVFSYFPETLDLLELQLNNSHIQFRRIDGSTKIGQGENAENDFSTNPEVRT